MPSFKSNIVFHSREIVMMILQIILMILLQPGLIESIQLSHLVQLYDHTMDWSYMGAYDGESFGSTQM